MGVSVQWDSSEHTALLYHFDESWTWEDFDAAIQRANTILSTLGHRVHIVLDLRQIERLPRGVQAYFRRLDDQAVSFHSGNVLVVRGKRFSESFWLYFWAIFSKTHQIPVNERSVLFVESLREARTIFDSVHA